MSNVIEVKGLSKKYRIGKAEKRADTVMGAIINSIKQPFQNLKQIRSLSKLNEDEESIFWALRDVSFEVKEGEVLGIIGHNGAGKSTLLKILSRITEPSDGEVHIKGRVAALLEVGTGFHPELTGRENIYMNGTILGMRKKEIDRKLDEIVDFSGVERHLDTPVKFYSSGMRVRLGFSVAAHLEPEILIVDEVLAVGDLEFQAKCLGKMQAVSTQGRTVIFVSHNLLAVNSLCTNGILLKDGKVAFEGAQSEVILKYQNYFLAKNSSEYVRINNLYNVIKNIRIHSVASDDFSQNIVSIGVDAVIEIDLDPANENYDYCSLAVGIYSTDDALVTSFKSKVQVNKRWQLSKNRTIQIMWFRVNLAPGEYSLKCAFGSQDKVLDNLTFAGRLRVVMDNDLYNSGNSVKQDQGYVVPFVKWFIDDKDKNFEE